MLSVVVSRRDIFVWYGVIIEEIIVVDYTATIPFVFLVDPEVSTAFTCIYSL